jgi:hypothetical protein
LNSGTPSICPYGQSCGKPRALWLNETESRNDLLSSGSATSRVKQTALLSPLEDLKRMASLSQWAKLQNHEPKSRTQSWRTIVVMPSNGFSSFPQSQTQAYGWRTFLLEFLYGLLAIAWYLLLLAESSVRRGLTWLARLSDLRPDAPSKKSGGRSALSDEAESSFGLQSNETHVSEFVVRTTLQGSTPSCVRQRTTFDKGH